MQQHGMGAPATSAVDPIDDMMDTSPSKFAVKGVSSKSSSDEASASAHPEKRQRRLCATLILIVIIGVLLVYRETIPIQDIMNSMQTETKLQGMTSRSSNNSSRLDRIRSAWTDGSFNNSSRTPPKGNTATTTRKEDTAAAMPVGDSYAVWDGAKGRYVVNMNATHVFWHEGQTKLCTILRNVTGVHELGKDTPRHVQESQPAPLLHLQFNCTHLAGNQDFGPGNYLTGFYMVRIAASLAQVDFQFTCLEGDAADRRQLLFPWFQGEWPATSGNNNDHAWPHNTTKPTEQDACTTRYPMIRVDLMTFEIQQDVRRMAIAILGPPPAYLNVADYVETRPAKAPLLPDIELDRVAIHFRCGDVFGGANRNDFGMIQFSAYKRYIDPKLAESIGIITQPFEEELNRPRDKRKVQACQKAVYALKHYLKEHFPKSKISIRNNKEETSPLAYARLVMASQAFTSLSSFGILPVVGTFGQGYFQKGNRGVNPWSNYVPDLLPNVHMMNAPFKGTWEIKKAGVDETIKWFIAARRRLLRQTL